ncbi:MAG: histidine phosphatase family protein [Gemmatimonadaceae bacterium]|nr:histidine phosphatase family protein [Gemmatimonadaceae bacterium]
MHRILRLAACLASAVAPCAVAAQETAPPPHWRIAYDTKPSSAPVFVKMPPGFHVTMGPGAVLWDPRVPGDARFEARGEVFVFPNSSEQEVAVMIGGQALGTPKASWTAFAIRRDGAFAVLQRRGGALSTLRPWTPHPAVKAAVGEEPALNALVVRVDSAVTFSVNGTVVAQLSREQVGGTDGATGWRAGAGVNLHIAAFDVLRQLAPPRNAAPSAPRSQTVFVVRHAERESRERDSDLSAVGRARAQALDSTLADARLTHVIVTEFKRTANTGAPAAARHGLTPIVIANQPDVAKHAAAVAAAVRAAGPDAVVLVVGHSNTVSPIVAALGGPVRPDLCDAQFATMTVVRLDGPGVPARVARVSYGAPDAERCPEPPR